MSNSKPTSVEEYIERAPDYAQEKLNEIHSILKSVAPKASEFLKWGQPVFIEEGFYFHMPHLKA